MNELRHTLETLSAPDAAKRLLGAELVCELEGGQACVKIVETEAYHQFDAASHSYKGQTPRTSVMFGEAAHLYVYFTYGMHYCCNVVTGPMGEGSAVLIRAVEPLEGVELLRRNRDKSGVEITNGPAKLCQALNITKSSNGHDLTKQPIQLVLRPQLPDSAITQTTRIGITKAVDAPWRFYVTNSQYVSRR